MKKGGVFVNSTIKSEYENIWLSLRQSLNLWTPMSSKEWVRKLNVLFPTIYVLKVMLLVVPPMAVYKAYVNTALCPSSS